MTIYLVEFKKIIRSKQKVIHIVKMHVINCATISYMKNIIINNFLLTGRNIYVTLISPNFYKNRAG